MYWNIMIQTADGDRINAFTWRGMKETGIARAKVEALQFKINAAYVWAEPAVGPKRKEAS